MVIVFKDCEEPNDVNLHLDSMGSTTVLSISDNTESDYQFAHFYMDDKTLFNFIGQLLRIQSEIKKGANNG